LLFPDDFLTAFKEWPSCVFGTCWYVILIALLLRRLRFNNLRTYTLQKFRKTEPEMRKTELKTAFWVGQSRRLVLNHMIIDCMITSQLSQICIID